MKLSRLKLYLDMCECLNEEPTVNGVRHYNKCVDMALKEMKSSNKCHKVRRCRF